MKRQAGGFVYVQTNDAEHKAVVVFARDAGGELERLGSPSTGGRGSGAPHLWNSAGGISHGPQKRLLGPASYNPPKRRGVEQSGSSPGS
jgi:hypothetical protein